MNSRRRVSLLQAARLRLRSVLALVGALTLFLVLFFSVRAWYASGRHHAVPPELAIEAHLAAFPEEVRYFPRDSGDIELLEKEFIDSWDREKALRATCSQIGSRGLRHRESSARNARQAITAASTTD